MHYGCKRNKFQEKFFVLKECVIPANIFFWKSNGFVNTNWGSLGELYERLSRDRIKLFEWWGFWTKVLEKLRNRIFCDNVENFFRFSMIAFYIRLVTQKCSQESNNICQTEEVKFRNTSECMRTLNFRAFCSWSMIISLVEILWSVIKI